MCSLLTLFCYQAQCFDAQTSERKFKAEILKIQFKNRKEREQEREKCLFTPHLAPHPLGLRHDCSLMHRITGSTCISPNGVRGGTAARGYRPVTNNTVSAHFRQLHSCSVRNVTFKAKRASEISVLT